MGGVGALGGGGGSERERRILEYIAANPGCTPYEIAKNIYGDGVKYSSAVFSSLRRIIREICDEVQLLNIQRDERGAYRIRLTEEGKILCQGRGLLVSSERQWVFIKELNELLDEPLSFRKIADLRKLLSEPVLDALEEIAKSYALELMARNRESLILALWAYDVEKNEIRPKFDDIFRYDLEKIMEVISSDPHLREKILEDAMMCRIDLKNRAASSMMCVPIAQKHGVEKELDDLVAFLRPIIEKNARAVARRETVLILSMWRLCMNILTIVSKMLEAKSHDHDTGGP